MAISEKLAKEVRRDLDRISGKRKAQGHVMVRHSNYWASIAFEEYLRGKYKGTEKPKN
jgi:hypothetical protein